MLSEVIGGPVDEFEPSLEVVRCVVAGCKPRFDLGFSVFWEFAYFVADLALPDIASGCKMTLNGGTKPPFYRLGGMGRHEGVFLMAKINRIDLGRTG